MDRRCGPTRPRSLLPARLSFERPYAARTPPTLIHTHHDIPVAKIVVQFEGVRPSPRTTIRGPVPREAGSIPAPAPDTGPEVAGMTNDRSVSGTSWILRFVLPNGHYSWKWSDIHRRGSGPPLHETQRHLFESELLLKLLAVFNENCAGR